MEHLVNLGFKEPMLASTPNEMLCGAIDARDRISCDMSFVKGILAGLSMGGCDEENPVYREFRDLLDSLASTFDDVFCICDFLDEVVVLDDGETHEH